MPLTFKYLFVSDWRRGVDGVLMACTAVVLRLILAVFAEGQACPGTRLYGRLALSGGSWA